MKKKVISAVLCLVMVMSMTACGQGKTKADEDGAKTAGTGSGSEKISFWYMGDGNTDIEPLINEFTEETGIEVEIISVPWRSLSEKLATAISSQSGPDVMQTAVSRTAELVNADAIIDMTEYVNSVDNFAVDNFFEASYDSLKIEDKYYGVPWFADVYVPFYRTDLFEEAGYEEFPKTWDEFYDACSKITEETGKYSFEILGASDYNFLFTFAYQSGSEIITEDRKAVFNEPEFVDAVTYLSSFYDAGLADRDNDGIDRWIKLANGDVSAVLGATWVITPLDEIPEAEGKWGMSVWPEGPATNDSVYAGSNLVIPTWTKNEDAAVKLIEFLTSAESEVKYYEQTKALPASIAAWEDEKIKSNEQYTVFNEQLSNAKQFPMVPEIEEIGILAAQEFERISVGKEDPQTVMDDLNEKAQAILDRNK